MRRDERRTRAGWRLAGLLQLIVVVALVAPAAAEHEFEDYFQDGLKNWGDMSGTWTVIGYENGKLLRQSSEDQRLGNSHIVTGRSFAASVMRTKVRFASGEDDDTMGAGIIFGFQDKNNYHIFRLAGEHGAVVGKVVNGKWKWKDSEPNARTPANPRVEAIEQAPWYDLRVHFNLPINQITCYVDDNAVFSFEDKEGFSTGKVGLTTFKSMADFAHFKVAPH